MRSLRLCGPASGRIGPVYLEADPAIREHGPSEVDLVEDRKSPVRSSAKWIGQLRFPAAILLFSVMLGTTSAIASPPQMTIASFIFHDTSGEARDQRSEHETRLVALVKRLEANLAASGKLRLIDIACGSQPCGADVSQSLEQARKAGARFVLFGAVHKMSTLVLSLPVRVIDAESGKVVFERFHSFRGDTDEAWQRAADFLARELATELSAKQ